MKVCEIFKSIEGEGLRTGQAAVFVRLHGCNLRCSYCDSMYAVEGSDFWFMNVGEILAAVETYRTETGVKCVTLTGGEPLIHMGVEELLTALSEAGFEVNVETNGTVPCKWRLPGLFYTMDWKCKSSGMSDRMKMENLATLCKDDVLKFVVGRFEMNIERPRFKNLFHRQSKRFRRTIVNIAFKDIHRLFIRRVLDNHRAQKIGASEVALAQSDARFQNRVCLRQLVLRL